MKLKKTTTLFLVFLIVFVSFAPCFAADSENSISSGSSLERFISVLSVWGGFLAKVTGSYDLLNNIGHFPEFVRTWHGFIGSDGFSPGFFFRTLLFLLGVDIMQQQQIDDDTSTESYSI